MSSLETPRAFQRRSSQRVLVRRPGRGRAFGRRGQGRGREGRDGGRLEHLVDDRLDEVDEDGREQGDEERRDEGQGDPLPFAEGELQEAKHGGGRLSGIEPPGASGRSRRR